MMWRGRGSDERGNVLILTALGSAVLLGVMSLVADAGFWFDRRLQLGAAADAAAWAAAQELKASSTANLQLYANHEVEDILGPMGITIGSGAGQTVSVTVNNPPSSGNFTCSTQPTTCDEYVEVIVTQQPSLFFAKVLGLSTSSLTIGNRAVAGPSSDTSGCIYALNSYGEDSHWTGDELDVDGDAASINTGGSCAAISNGGLNVQTGSSITASAIDVAASSMTGGGTVSPSPTFNQPQTPDPEADLNETSLFGSAPWSSCAGPSASGSGGFKTPVITSGSASYSGGQFYCRSCTATLYAGLYCGNGSSGGPGSDVHAIDVDSNGPSGTTASITYSSGTYILDGGGLWEQHTVGTGTGVTFYFTSDSTHAYEPCGGVEVNIDPNGSNNLTLSAPTSGPLAGLLMVRDRTSPICTDNAPEIELQPNAADLVGVIYFPYDHLQYCNETGTTTSPYTVLIGGTVEIQGGSSDDCTTNTVDYEQTSYTGAGYSQSPIQKTALAE